jgi:imidazolonepropionase
MAKARATTIAADLLLTNVAQLVTCEPALGDGPLGVIDDGALAASDGRIVWVGRARDADAQVKLLPTGRRVDARGRIALPGFVDSHTHLCFAGSREQEYAMRAAGASYQEIAAAGGGILSTVRATRDATAEELVASGRPRLAMLLAHGTTTVEVKSGYGLATADELKMLEAIARLAAAQPVDLHATFCGAHEVPPDFKVRADA